MKAENWPIQLNESTGPDHEENRNILPHSSPNLKSIELELVGFWTETLFQLKGNSESNDMLMGNKVGRWFRSKRQAAQIEKHGLD